MRMIPSRYISKAQPVQIKRAVSRVEHVSAPLKGLNLSSKLTTGDPLTAPILDNWVLEEDRITCRPGTRLVTTIPAAPAIHALIPYEGSPKSQTLAAATALYKTDGSLLLGGFNSGDWHWTAFSNLADIDYTVMVNGVDGVWSWQGGANVPVKETVTAPAGKPHIIPNNFQIVTSHMNRLWFADNANMSVCYLPLQQKAGEIEGELPLNAVFKHGGTIRAMHSWTVDGGAGLDDQLVIFSSNGECAIYNGTDPQSDFGLVGIYRFDAPMSKHCVVSYGGDAYMLMSTGAVPLSTMMRAENERLLEADKGVRTMFLQHSGVSRSEPGWQMLLDPSTGRMICNLPHGGNHYHQMIRHMPRPFWSNWENLPARCWSWVDNRLYFATDDGRLFEMSPLYLSDNGEPIRVDVQGAWSSFRTPASKHFKMIKPFLITDGSPRPTVDIRVDYDSTVPFNQPDVSTGIDTGAVWDEAEWNDAEWALTSLTQNHWNGVTGAGSVGAPRLTALILNCKFSLTGWDVLFEPGSVMG